MAYYCSSRGFVSDGPIVNDWRWENGARITGDKWYVASTEQYRVKLSVESEVPITDIMIYDGPVLLRRFAQKSLRSL